MKVAFLLRRIHLYLGLALMPWVVVYGLSSIPFAHNEYFQRRDREKGLPAWTLRFEREYDRPVPSDNADLRAFGRSLMDDLGVTAPNLAVARPNANTITVTAYSFRHFTRITYLAARGIARVEDRRFRFDQFLTGMHGRGGFNQEGFLPRLWGVLVDVVCLAIVAWILTGLVLWWGVGGHRLWGGIALLGGGIAFLFFTALL